MMTRIRSSDFFRCERAGGTDSTEKQEERLVFSLAEQDSLQEPSAVYRAGSGWQRRLQTHVSAHAEAWEGFATSSATAATAAAATGDEDEDDAAASLSAAGDVGAHMPSGWEVVAPSDGLTDPEAPYMSALLAKATAALRRLVVIQVRRAQTTSGHTGTACSDD